MAKAETWSCEQSRANKTVKQVWNVSDDRLTTPGEERYYRIVTNDQRALVAFRKDWEYKIGGGTRFRQIDINKSHVHHDALEFPDGQCVLVTQLMEGQRATVLQLPATPQEKAQESQRDSLSLDPVA